MNRLALDKLLNGIKILKIIKTDLGGERFHYCHPFLEFVFWFNQDRERQQQRCDRMQEDFL